MNPPPDDTFATSAIVLVGLVSFFQPPVIASMFHSDQSPRSQPCETDSTEVSESLGPAYPQSDRRRARPQRIDSLSPAPAAGFGRRSGDTYLESMIATASPAKLRLMLIERSVEVARHLAGLWRQTPGKRGTNEYSLKLFELLSELLSGVTDDKVEVCRTVADMYVFLCQHVLAAEDNGDATMIDEIRLVLETEAETWRMVCVQESGRENTQSRAAELLAGPPRPPRASSSAGSGTTAGLNLQG